jgi:hypothetical protein
MEAMEHRLFLDDSQLTVVLDSSTLMASAFDHAPLTGKMTFPASISTATSSSR